MEELNEGASAPAPDTAAPPTALPDTPPSTPEDDGKPDEAAVEKTMSDIYRKMNPERDEFTGRFTGKNDQAPTTEEKPAAETAVIPVPSSWSADVSAKWATLSPDVQTYIAQREKEASDRITQQGQLLSAVEPIFEQAQQNGQRVGMHEGDYLQNLINADQMLLHDPANAIQEIANAYGVNLWEMFGQQQQSDGQEAPPIVQQLYQKIDQLESALRQTSQQVNEREQRETAQAFASIEDQIAKFAEGKTDFNELADEITAQIAALKVSNPQQSPQERLAKAYENARWATPAARERMLAEQRQAEEKKRMEEAKKRTEDARRSNSINVRSQTANGKSPVSIDETLSAVYRAAQSR